MAIFQEKINCKQTKVIQYNMRKTKHLFTKRAKQKSL